jgi:hypothetical protein
MWFHTNYFVPPKQSKFNGEEGQFKEGSFTITGENKIKDGSFTISGEKKD